MTRRNRRDRSRAVPGKGDAVETREPSSRTGIPGWDRAEAWSGRNGGWVVAAMALAMLVALGAIEVTKYRYYLYDDFDLALFHQAVLQLLRGSLFTSIRGMAWPGDHSSLVLIVIAPLAAVIRHPLLLPFVQSAALVAGGAAVHRLARSAQPSAIAALALAAVWLLQPALGYVALYEFHPEALAVPALLFAVAFARERRRGAALVCAAIALLAKEDVAFAVGTMGVLALVGRRRDARLAAGWMVLAALSVALTFLVLKPRFDANVVDYGRLYLHIGSTTGEAIRALLADPIRTVQWLLGTPGDPIDNRLKHELWLQVLMPWGFLPLAAPLAFAPALPILAENLLAWRRENHAIVFQYMALALPFLGSASVNALARLVPRAATEPARRGRAAMEAAADTVRRRQVAIARSLALVTLAAAAASLVLFGPFFGLGVAQHLRAAQPIRPDAYARAAKPWRDALVRRLAGRDTLVVSFPFLTHVSDRRVVHSAHHVLDGRYTFSSARYPDPDAVGAVLLDLGVPGMSGRLDTNVPARWAALAKRNRLRAVDAIGDMMLFVRDAPDTFALLTPDSSAAPGTVYRFGHDLELLDARLAADHATPGGLVPILMRWRRPAPLDRLHQVELVLFDSTGRAMVRCSHPIGYGLEPPMAWPENEARGMRERYMLLLPDDVPRGRYRVALAVGWRAGGSGEMLPVAPPPAADGLVTVGTLNVD
jgi:uncharacterized membrane protein